VKPFNLEQLVVTIENLLSDSFLNLLKDKERLHSERKMMLGSIVSIVAALEARHSYAEGHSQRVAKIVKGMAEVMEIGPEDIDMLEIAAKIHNLGYIAVPDKILLKPGKLTVEEYDLMKEHPAVGAEIIGTNPALKDIVPALRSHHERYDGFGYPDGLKQEEPHLWARMIAVADTFDAITSIRPYRSAQSREYAIDTLKEIRGTQLCPKCVDAFLTWLETAPKKI